MPDATGRIYALRDPETLAIHYVGQTVHPAQTRMYGHLNAARHGTTRCAHWLRSLPTEPVVTVLEDAVPRDELDSREQHWITTMRRRHEPLMNSPFGGEGGENGS